MAAWGYERPGSIAEVTALLAHPAARPLAGGTDLMVQIRDGGRAPGTLVDLTFVPALGMLANEPGGGLRIGAAVRLASLETDPRCRPYPLLQEAAATVGSVQVRHRATLVGNVCHGSPAADTAPALLCYDAVLHLLGPGGARTVSVEDFWTGPGQTVLRPGEWVEAVTLPPPPPHGGCYAKLGRTLGADLAVAGVAALASADGVRLAAAAVAPVPCRLRAAEEALAAAPAGTLPDLTGAVAVSIAPVDDVRASAVYRRAMTVVLARRAVAAARERFAALEGGAR